MYNQPKARFVVPAAMAILLTFGRGGMLMFEDIYTLLDHSMNFFVVIVAPIFAFKDIYPRPLNRNLHLFLPLFLLACWVSVCVVVGSPSKYWPERTPLISIVLSILLASQITCFELRRLRHCVLLLTGIFSCYTLFFAQSTLYLIFSGGLETRLGIDISPANVIILPRVMYMLVITCFISLVIEKSTWIRICLVAIVIIPILIAFAAGSRGALLGLIVAGLVFVFGLHGKLKSIYALLVAGILAVIGYRAINSIFPLLQHRIMERQHEERIDIWTSVFDVKNVSWFGCGLDGSYPHNIFLEFYLHYGIVGLVLFLLVLATSVITIYKFYSKTRDIEVLWVISLLVLQMTAHQFSLDIFYGSLWAVIVLPLGFGWNRSPDYTSGNVLVYGNSNVRVIGYTSTQCGATNSSDRFSSV